MSSTDNLTNLPQNETLYLNHPLTSGKIVNLSFSFYFKDIFLHLLPFLVIVSLNFVINSFLIDKAIPYDSSIIANVNLSQQTIPPEVVHNYIYYFANTLVAGVINNGLLTIAMAISVLVVKNRINNEQKAYGKILREVFSMIPKLVIIGGIVTFLMYFGIILVFIGYFLFSVWFSLTTVIIVQKEDKGFFSSLSKSKNLVNKNLIFVFLTLIFL